MFCHITENWRSRPLESLMTVVNLISNTNTTKGLTISADLDERLYETGTKITEEQMKTIAITNVIFMVSGTIAYLHVATEDPMLFMLF